MSPESYELHDSRFVQEVLVTSAPNALILASAAVPAGKVRTYLHVSYYPTVAETRTVLFHLVGRGGLYHPVTRPVAVALDSVYLIYSMLTEGLELRAYPGDSLRVVRDVATAGSSMNLTTRYIDIDLPYYSYEEPLKKIIEQHQKHSSVVRAGGGGRAEGGGGGRAAGGGGGGPKPI